MAEHNQQKEFESAVVTVNSMFPNQVKGRPLLDRWPECQAHIEQALSLAKTFKNHSKDLPPLKTLPELGGLLKNCVWYLYESGRLDDALGLLDTAYQTVPNKESALYAHLCNSAAVVYFEQNNLTACRRANEKSLRIRKAVLAPDDLDLVNSYHNLGNLASAQGRYEEALELLAQTEKVRVAAGQEAVISLGLTHMMIGRVFSLQGKYSEALDRYDMAAEIFKLSLGPASQLMADLIYAYGNLQLAQNNVDGAKELYEKGCKMAHDLGPIHLQTATFEYKIGVVEALSTNYGNAMEHLQTALDIVKKHRARGDLARILRRKALVIRENPLSTPMQMKEADTLMESAETIRAELSDHGDQDDNGLPEDLAYDNLVCGYRR